MQNVFQNVGMELASNCACNVFISYIALCNRHFTVVLWSPLFRDIGNAEAHVFMSGLTLYFLHFCISVIHAVGSITCQLWLPQTKKPVPYPTRGSIPGFESVRSMLRILKVGFPEQQLASLLDYLSRQAFLETNIHNSLFSSKRKWMAYWNWAKHLL